ncbi:MAG: hypothetical protein JWL69_4801 [Phycisphaerales bacterium]|jgi:hypothetical protein|nr:hypothetical protein [Phycisphaerales bacterium]
MKRRFHAAAMVLICACLSGADSSNPPPFKSYKAKDARAFFDAEMKKADEEYAAKSLKAMKTYRDALVQAKAIATKSGDLDDANAIQATIKRLDESMSDDAAPAKTRSALVINKARWGSGAKWEDVTKLAQSKVENGALKPMGALPDPVFGQQKTLVMEGLYGGRPFMIVYNTADPQGNFYFGRPKSE